MNISVFILSKAMHCVCSSGVKWLIMVEVELLCYGADLGCYSEGKLLEVHQPQLQPQL